MANIGTLAADLRLETAAFKADMNKAVDALKSGNQKMVNSLSGVEKAFGGLKTAVAGFGATVASAFTVRAIFDFGRESVKAFNEAEQSANRLSAALKSTGRYSDATMQRITNNATAISRATMIEDDALTEATATFANFAKKLNGTELSGAQKAIVGLSTVMKIDLDTAAKQIGKTVSGASNTIGRSGIEISKTTDQSQRLAEVIQKLNGFYSTAENLAGTNTGRTEQLKNAWQNFQETLGQTTTQGTNTTGVIKAITDRVIQLDDFLKQHQNTIARLMQIAAEGSKVVFYGISSVVNVVASGIVNTVNRAVESVNFLLKGTINNLNNFLKLINVVSPKKIGMISNKGIPNPFGKGGEFAGAKDALLHSAQNDAALMGKSFGNMFASRRFNFSAGGGISIPNNPDNSPSGSSGGKSKKAAKDKELDKLKSEAEAIRERNRTIFEIEKEGMAKLNQLRSKHLVDLETYRRESARLNKELMDAIKVPTEDIKASTDRLLDPFRDLMKSMEGSVKTSDEFNQKLSESKNLFESIKTPLQEYQDKVQNYANLLSEGFIPSQQAFNDLVSKAQKEFIDSQEGSKATAEKYDLLAGALSNVGNKLEDVFVTAVTRGKISFKDFAMSIAEDLTRLIFKLTVTIPLVNALNTALKNQQQAAAAKKASSLLSPVLSLGSSLMGGALGGGSAIGSLLTAGPSALSLGGASSFLSSLPGRASGGPVTQNSPYIVGERGPELFIPGNTGRIHPDLGGGGSPVVINNVFNLKSGDSKQNEDFSKQATKMIEAQVRAAVNNEIRIQKRPGGQLYGN